MSNMKEKTKYRSKRKSEIAGKAAVYIILLIITAAMVVPFLWMLSASIKSNREVFLMDPFEWIPKEPKWDNYIKIWTKIPLLKFVQNTVFLTIVVTILQLVTSSFAAYSFAKLEFKHKNALFMAYIATIAMPWQVYMVPQFIMMRGMGLNDRLLAMICLQAFSAFGVFLMKQFYEGIPSELCEAARIDGMSEYRIYAKIMLPLGLKMFIGQYSAEYGLIMAGSVVSLIPVIIVFLCLQKYFVEGVASTGLKG